MYMYICKHLYVRAQRNRQTHRHIDTHTESSRNGRFLSGINIVESQGKLTVLQYIYILTHMHIHMHTHTHKHTQRVESEWKTTMFWKKTFISHTHTYTHPTHTFKPTGSRVTMEDDYL